MLEAQDLVFRARALAQAHPLTPLASRYVKRAANQEQASQPLSEFGVWAVGALVDGYCLRRVEEEEDGTEAPSPGGDDGRFRNGTCLGPPHDPVAGRPAPHQAAGDWSQLDAIGPLDPIDPLDRLDEVSSRIASQLRVGLSTGDDAFDHEERTVAALDRLVASAVERRLDHLRDDVDGEAWIELGQYLTWWVVKGYALRVAEC